MISIKTILVPTDLSSISVSAIGYAGFLAKSLDAEVVLLHVVPTEAMKEHFTGGYPGVGFPMDNEPAVRRRPDMESIYETRKQVLLGFLDQKIGADFRKTIKLRLLVQLGNVYDEILAAAKEQKCDLIIMTGQAAGLSRLFGRSLTERIVRNAPCPVLSMQPSAEVRTENDERVAVRLIDRWAA